MNYFQASYKPCKKSMNSLGQNLYPINYFQASYKIYEKSINSLGWNLYTMNFKPVINYMKSLWIARMKFIHYELLSSQL